MAQFHLQQEKEREALAAVRANVPGCDLFRQDLKPPLQAAVGYWILSQQSRFQNIPGIVLSYHESDDLLMVDFSFGRKSMIGIYYHEDGLKWYKYESHDNSQEIQEKKEVIPLLDDSSNVKNNEKVGIEPEGGNIMNRQKKSSDEQRKFGKVRILRPKHSSSQLASEKHEALPHGKTLSSKESSDEEPGKVIFKENEVEKHESVENKANESDQYHSRDIQQLKSDGSSLKSNNIDESSVAVNNGDSVISPEKEVTTADTEQKEYSCKDQNGESHDTVDKVRNNIQLIDDANIDPTLSHGDYSHLDDGGLLKNNSGLKSTDEVITSNKDTVESPRNIVTPTNSTVEGTVQATTQGENKHEEHPDRDDTVDKINNTNQNIDDAMITSTPSNGNDSHPDDVSDGASINKSIFTADKRPTATTPIGDRDIFLLVPGQEGDETDEDEIGKVLKLDFKSGMASVKFIIHARNADDILYDDEIEEVPFLAREIKWLKLSS